MPHLGTLFGLNELAMFAILFEMGCIQKYEKTKYRVHQLGFDSLISEFKVESIEVSQTKLAGTKYWFVGQPIQRVFIRLLLLAAELQRSLSLKN